MDLALFSWIISSLINCNTLHLYALNQQVLPPEEEVWILNLTAKCPTLTLNCCEHLTHSPLSQKRMVLNKLGEARAFQTEGRKKASVWYPSANSHLRPAAEAAHTDVVLKTRGGWIRPWLAKNDDQSLTYPARHLQQREKLHNRKTFLPWHLQVSWVLRKYLPSWVLELRKRGIHIKTYVQRLGCIQSVDINWHLLAQLKLE